MNESHINLTFSWWILDVSRFLLVKSQYPSTNPMKSQQYPSIFAGETPAFFPSPRDSSMLLEQMGLMETVLRSSIHKDTLSGFVTWLKRFAGWWYTYPSEKKSQLGWWNSQYMGKMFQTTNQFVINDSSYSSHSHKIQSNTCHRWVSFRVVFLKRKEKLVRLFFGVSFSSKTKTLK